jgi:hypothetical protein
VTYFGDRIRQIMLQIVYQARVFASKLAACLLESRIAKNSAKLGHGLEYSAEETFHWLSQAKSPFLMIRSGQLG